MVGGATRGREKKEVGVALGLVTLLSVGIAACGSSSAPTTAPETGPGSTSVPVPSVQGPIEPTSKISFVGSTLFPLAPLGYEQKEFFLSGTADSYTSKAPLSTNGQWDATTATKAPYTTRVVVYRPIDPKRFDGTVVVEWLNVTGGVGTDCTLVASSYPNDS